MSGRSGGLHFRLSKIHGLTPKGYLDDPIFFQNAPTDEWQVTYGHVHSTFETVRTGEYSRRAGRLLRQTNLNTLALDDDVPWNAYEDVDRHKLKKRLIKVSEEGVPFWLRVVRDPHNADDTTELNMKATLVQLQVSERAGEPDAYYFTCSFTEYRDPSVDRKSSKRTHDATRHWPTHFTLRKSDEKTTLAKLSRTYYGTVKHADIIAKANKLGHWGHHTALVKNPIVLRRMKHNLLKLVIPAPPKKANRSVSDSVDDTT